MKRLKFTKPWAAATVTGPIHCELRPKFTVHTHTILRTKMKMTTMKMIRPLTKLQPMKLLVFEMPFVAMMVVMNLCCHEEALPFDRRCFQGQWIGVSSIQSGHFSTLFRLETFRSYVNTNELPSFPPDRQSPASPESASHPPKPPKAGFLPCRSASVASSIKSRLYASV